MESNGVSATRLDHETRTVPAPSGAPDGVSGNPTGSAGILAGCATGSAGILAGCAVELFGIRVSRIGRKELFRCIEARIASRRPAFIVTPNVDHVCRCQSDLLFKQAYDAAFLATPDGVPILWAAKLLGKPLREKLSGSDMVPLLSGFAAEKGYSVFFLGAAEGIAEEAARRLRLRHPALKVAGCYSPPMQFEKDPAQNAEVIRRLRDTTPDLCFVALGSPRQEIWMHRHSEISGVPVMIGIGAGLDFIAGRVRRAPLWMQRAGVEWIWRLGMEPRRLWRRYFIEDSLFLVLLWREFWKQRRDSR